MIRTIGVIFVFSVFAAGLAVWLWFDAGVAPQRLENGTVPPMRQELAEERRDADKGQKGEIPLSAESGPKAAPVTTLLKDVPFAPQAPFGEWGDPIFQNACEEASLVMAARWISGEPLSREEAREEILALSRFEKDRFGHAIDTSIADTEKIFREYYGGIAFSEVRTDVTPDDMREALASGALLIVPADGRRLGNPNYTQPGPPEHMLVVIGYDAEKVEFVTNDPGTHRGEGYRYPEHILYAAIADYPTADRHLPRRQIEKAMMIVKKRNSL